MLDAGAAVAAALGVSPTLNFQGMWYAAPAESEAGWGIDFAHQDEVIFATWFTHDAQRQGVVHVDDGIPHGREHVHGNAAAQHRPRARRAIR
jgi:hypothetical protein